MRIGVVDIGTNSTRLLVADVTSHEVTELDRRSEVTRLGEGLEDSGALGEQPMERVFGVLEGYRAVINKEQVEQAIAVLTSAAREAANGDRFASEVERRFGLSARVVSGDEEAQLTYLGAMSARSERAEPTAVFDIGGGSTEVIVGRARRAEFHVSMPVGVVRLTERHLHGDPPRSEELRRLVQATQAQIQEDVPKQARREVSDAVAVAGTATASAAMDQELEPYDPGHVHGYRLSRGAVESLLARLGTLTNQQRRDVVGLHPDRAPTIVAGLAILRELMAAFGLQSVDVSEHDILRGAVLAATDGATRSGGR